MSGLRLALVTRRFWPLTGATERTVSNLACELLQRGHQPTIVTPRYGKHWPAKVCIREAPVERLPYPPPKSWGNVRYLYSLTRWLQGRRRELDAVLVFGQEDDAVAVLSAIRNSPPIVFCLDPTIDSGGTSAIGVFGERLRRRARECDAIVRQCAAPASQAWLHELPPGKLHVFEPGVAVPPPRGAVARLNARQAVVEVNHDLGAGPDAPVALCLSPLVSEAQLKDLVHSWRAVQARWPEARLWIVGDGPQRSPLFHLISDLDLKYRVVLPGTFDDWADLLQAADLLIQPSGGCGNDMAVVEAMAAGLPVLRFGSAANSTSLDGIFAANRPPGDLTTIEINQADMRLLGRAIIKLFDHPVFAVRLGDQGRQWAIRERSLPAMADRYEQLLESLVSVRTSPN